MMREFREFARRGNMMDMTVGVIMGTAFGQVTRSLISDIIMPPLGLFMQADFSDLYVLLREGARAAPYTSLADARDAGAVVIAYGSFTNAILSFLTVAVAMFIVVRGINRLRRPEEKARAPEPTRECEFCFSRISPRALRCPHCTSRLSTG